MKYVLVTSSHNWADEFDRTGAAIMERDAWEKHVAGIKAWWAANKGESQHKYFGTNEALNWDSARDYLDGFSVKDITQEQVETFQELFGDTTVGDFEMLDENAMENSKGDGY